MTVRTDRLPSPMLRAEPRTADTRPAPSGGKQINKDALRCMASGESKFCANVGAPRTEAPANTLGRAELISRGKSGRTTRLAE